MKTSISFVFWDLFRLCIVVYASVEKIKSLLFLGQFFFHSHYLRLSFRQSLNFFSAISIFD